MKKYIAVILSGLLLSVLIVKDSPHSEFVISQWQVTEYREQTVAIGIFKEDMRASGSGVMINKKGLILTAAHVVSDPEIELILVKIYRGSVYQAKLIAYDNRRDLALIQLVDSHQRFNYAKVQSKARIWVGQDILICGHPNGHTWLISVGIISNFAFSFGYFCVIAETTTYIHPGSSGGPVFNDQGEVIGIVSAMYTDMEGTPSGVGIFIPIKQIHQFLRNSIGKINGYKHKRPRLRIGDLR